MFTNFGGNRCKQNANVIHKFLLEFVILRNMYHSRFIQFLFNTILQKKNPKRKKNKENTKRKKKISTSFVMISVTLRM